MKRSLFIAVCSLLAALPLLVLVLIDSWQVWQEEAKVLAVLFALVACPISSAIAIGRARQELGEGGGTQSRIALTIGTLWFLVTGGFVVWYLYERLRYGSMTAF